MRLATIALGLLLAGCATSTPPAPAVPPPPAANAKPPVPLQYLYGSAEAAALVRQSYARLTAYAVEQVKRRPQNSVVLTSGATVDNPKFEPCGDKPFAAVFDADETLVWNLGAMRYFAEQGTDFDPLVWDQWEKSGAGKAKAMPGAAAMVDALRKAGVTVIANTNRSAANAKGSEDTLRAAGLGDFKHGETLFLMGDDAGGSSKDQRRSTIASRFCVIILAGDQLGDFSQQFNDKSLSGAARTALATGPTPSALWDSGWFLLPNPVYGPWQKLDWVDIFSNANKWEPQS